MRLMIYLKGLNRLQLHIGSKAVLILFPYALIHSIMPCSFADVSPFFPLSNDQRLNSQLRP
jgi:hypothetical protein